MTISDIDFKEHTINIDHQLQKKSKIGYYIQETKTTSGIRKIPMTSEVEESFKKIIEKRNPPKAEPMVNGKSGFLYFYKDGSICYSLQCEHYFKHIIQKYNNTYKVQMPVITLHICRHTYCSNMAKSGINPKALQYLMGHSDISATLNTYTHVNLEDAREEVARLRIVQLRFYNLKWQGVKTWNLHHMLYLLRYNICHNTSIYARKQFFTGAYKARNIKKHKEMRGYVTMIKILFICHGNILAMI